MAECPPIRITVQLVTERDLRLERQRAEATDDYLRVLNALNSSRKRLERARVAALVLLAPTWNAVKHLEARRELANTLDIDVPVRV